MQRPLEVIADTSERCIEDRQVIKKILEHLRERAGTDETPTLPENRVPPVGLFD